MKLLDLSLIVKKKEKKKKKAFCYKFNLFNERAVTQMHFCLERASVIAKNLSVSYKASDSLA